MGREWKKLHLNVLFIDSTCLLPSLFVKNLHEFQKEDHWIEQQEAVRKIFKVRPV